MLDFITSIIYAIIRISTPIIFVAICSTISAQAGLMNMAGESMMLVASLAGVVFSAIFQNVWLGILCGMLAAMICVLIICFAAESLIADIITGIFLFCMLGCEFFINYKVIVRGKNKEVAK